MSDKVVGQTIPAGMLALTASNLLIICYLFLRPTRTLLQRYLVLGNIANV